MADMAAEHDFGKARVQKTVRLALSGQANGANLPVLIAVMGRQRVCERLRKAASEVTFADD